MKKIKDIINRYKTQNTKGLKGIKKILNEEKTMFIWKIENLIYKLNIFY